MRTQLRADEARSLLGAGHWAGAYYLAGYAVECALKAVIASRIRSGDFPPKPDLVRRMYSHDLAGLLRIAEIAPPPAPEVRSRWNVASEWRVESRYDTGVSEQKARALVESVTDDQNGILLWLSNQ
jgi:HEPN domain-containing protein